MNKIKKIKEKITNKLKKNCKEKEKKPHWRRLTEMT